MSRRRRPRTRSRRAAIPTRAQSHGRISPTAEQSGRSPVRGRARVAALAARLRRGRSLWDLSLGALVAPLRRAPAGTVPPAVDAHALDAARVGVEHLDLETARARHELPAHRHAPDPR